MDPFPVLSPQQRRAQYLIDVDGSTAWDAHATIRVEGAVDKALVAAVLTELARELPGAAPDHTLRFRWETVDGSDFLHLNISPVAADAATLDLIFAELSRRLTEEVCAPDRPNYERAAQWATSMLQAEEMRDDREYWARASEAPCSGLPTVLPPGDDVCTETLPLEPGTFEAAMALAEHCGHEIETVLLAAWAALAARLCDTEVVTLGLVTSGRDFPELQEVLGPLARQVPFRVDVPGQQTFGAFLQRITEAKERAEDAQISFDPMDAFVSGFAFAEEPALPEHKTPVQSLKMIRRLAPIEQFEVKLVCRPDGGTLCFDATRVSIDAARALLRQLLALLNSTGLETVLCDLNFVGTKERDWQTDVLSASDLAIDDLLLDRIANHAARRPEALVVVDPEVRLDYGGLAAQADVIAGMLVGRVLPGAIIAIQCDRPADFLTRAVGVMRAGCAWLPINPDHPLERTQQIIAGAGAHIALTDADGPIPADALGIEMLDHRTKDPAGAPPVWPDIAPTDIAYVMPTSGSTGAPKLVLVSHGSLAAYAAGIVHDLGLSPETSAAAISSLASDLPLTAVLSSLWTGSHVIVGTTALGDQANALAAFLGRERPDLLKAVPSHLSALLNAADDPAGLLPKRWLLLGGESPDPALLKRICALAPDCEILNHYGPTETTIGVTVGRAGPGKYPADRIPIGTPLPGVQLLIRDHSGRDVPVGAVGELFIGGATLASGYHDAPQATAAAFLRETKQSGRVLYRSGDLVRLLPSGQLQHLGRKDAQLNIRGVRIEPAGLEGHLRDCEGIVDAGVTLNRDSASVKERLIAWIVTEGTADYDLGVVRSHLAALLPREMIPDRFIIGPPISRLASGKVDRIALAARSVAETDTSVTEDPEGSTEQALAKIWCDVLKVDRVGRHDVFFELGGDSIQSIAVVARAQQVGMTITVRQIFEEPTIAGLAALATPRSAEPLAPAAGLQTKPVNTNDLPLTPNLAWLLDRNPDSFNHFNQAMRVGLAESPHVETFQRALDALVDRHEVMRIRVDAVARRHRIADRVTPVRIERLDLGGMDGEARQDAERALMDQLHTGLNLANGPLLAAAFVTPGANSKADLLLAAHHACVDGMSWQILLKDLHATLDQIDEGKSPTSAENSLPWSAWATALSARAADMGHEREWWQDRMADKADLVPGMLWEQATGRVGSAEYLVHPLSGVDPGILKWLPRMLDVTAQELLLGTLARACASALGRNSVLVEVEAHGREAIPDGPDPAGTVGWLTARFPIRLEAPPGADLDSWVRAVRESLRAVPEGGRGWSQLGIKAEPFLSFTYFGQATFGFEGGRYTSIGLAPGKPRHAETLRAAPLEVSVELGPKEPIMRWSWNTSAIDKELVSACAKSAGEGLAKLYRRIGPPADLAPRMLDLYELSPMQQGILLDSLAAGDGVYVSQQVIELRGPLDPDRMIRAWAAAVARHSALRSGILWDGLSRPLQFVAGRVTPRVTVEDLRAADNPAKELEQLMERDRAIPFALERPALMRVHLVQLDDEDWRMVWSRHHVMLDGWSAAIVLRDVMTGYAQDEAPEAGNEAPQYGAWIRALRRSDPESLRAFWSAELDGAAPTLLKGSGLRHSAGGRQRRRSITISEGVIDALADRMGATGTTQTALVEALWAVLLADLSGRSDVLFGVTTSGRHAHVHGVDAMAGMLINTLPLRATLKPSQSFLTFAAELQRRWLHIQEHHASSLVEIARLAGTPKLFDTIIVAGNYPIDRTGGHDIAGLELGMVDTQIENSLPLTLRVIPGPPFTLQFLYNLDAFENDWVTARLSDLARLLSRVSADPEITTGQLQAGLGRPNAVMIPRQERGTILDMLAGHADQQAASDAMSFGETQLTWGELNAQVEKIALQLVEVGIRPGDIIALPAHRTAELLITQLAISRAGAVVLPLDPGLPEARCAEILKSAGASNIIIHGVDAWLGTECRCLRLSELPQPATSGVSLLPNLHPDMLVWVVATSGSTGEPKLVAVSHAAASAYAYALADRAGLPPNSKWASPASAAADLGYSAWLGALATGGSVHLFPDAAPEDAEVFAKEMSRHGIDCLKITPSHLSSLLAAEGPEVLPRLLLILGGEAPSPKLVETIRQLAPHIRIMNHYGPTECTVGVIAGDIVPKDDPDGPQNMPLGIPLKGVKAVVLDQQMQPVPDGEAGELFLGGACLARGYLGQASLTAERFLPDPNGGGERLYRTGDRVLQMSDERFVWLGRLDRQVKLRGHLVEPAEIEAALLRLSCVTDAAAVVRHEANGSARLDAYAVARDQAVEDILQRLATVLPSWIVPAQVTWLESMPLTSSGKIDRKALPNPQGAQRKPMPEHAGNEVEAALLPIWKEVLETADLSVSDEFFAIGGDSLKAIQLTSRLRTVFQTDIPVRLIFERTTVRSMADGLLALPDGSDQIARVASVLARLHSMPAEEQAELLARRRRGLP